MALSARKSISHPTPWLNQVCASRPCRQSSHCSRVDPTVFRYKNVLTLSPKKTSVVRDKPQINPGRSADVEDTEGMSTPTEESGDLLIRNLWKHQTDCILDVLITNLDAPSNIHRKRDFMKHFNCFLYHNNSIPYNNLQLIHSLAKNILRIPTSRVSQHRQWDDGACLSLCSTIRWTT